VTATVSTTYSAPSGYLVVNVSGSYGDIKSDAGFVVQPVSGDQIVYPAGLQVTPWLDISGPDGSYVVYHVIASTGVIHRISYSISGYPVLANVSTQYTSDTSRTTATLSAGFDDYLFEFWPPGEPAVGWQFTTVTADGFFDELGNFYTDNEQVIDFWVTELDGTLSYQTIDTTGLEDPLNIVGVDLGPDRTGLDPSEQVDISFTISGIATGSVTMSVTGVGLASKNDGEFLDAMSVVNGDSIVLRGSASADFDATVSMGVVFTGGSSESVNLTTRSIITPSVTAQPVDAQLLDGDTLSFVAAWDVLVTVQWYEVGVGALTGEVAEELTFSVVIADDGRRFYAIGTSIDGLTAQTNTVTLGVTSPEDVTLPVFISPLSASQITPSTFLAGFTVGESSAVSIIVVPSGSATPTAAQVRAGVDYDDVTILSHSVADVVANIPTSVLMFGIDGYAGQEVTAYAVALDAAENYSLISSISVIMGPLGAFWSYQVPKSRVLDMSDKSVSVQDKDAVSNYWLDFSSLIGSNVTVSDVVIDPDASLSDIVIVGQGVNDVALTDSEGEAYRVGVLGGIKVSGGVAGVRYRVLVRITLSSNETDDRTICIDVVEK
tara:strand:- start:469 stop:2283 length:1815 start_codon:yes stop_codon:yes gene_type:complete